MKIEDWGLIEYGASVDRQLATVEAVAAGGEDRLVLCTHPPVVTLGRATTEADLVGWSGAVHESSRGGRATYHGPNQIVVYPIIDLRRARGGIPERDIHAYLRALEQATVAGLSALDLPNAEARTQKQEGLSLTGVWVGPHKIASIGIAVRKWITYHGVAINILDDAQAFQGIRPCGFTASVMTNVERETGWGVDLAAARDVLAREFARALE